MATAKELAPRTGEMVRYCGPRNYMGRVVCATLDGELLLEPDPNIRDKLREGLSVFNSTTGEIRPAYIFDDVNKIRIQVLADTSRGEIFVQGISLDDPNLRVASFRQFMRAPLIFFRDLISDLVSVV